MIDINLIILFSITTFVLMITPGTDMVFVVSNALSSGRKAGVASILGVASGAYIHVILATLGVAAIISTSPTIYNTLVLVGALYMGWIGWSIFTHHGAISSLDKVPQRTLKKVYMQGVMTNLLNPKAIIFTLSFFPQFISRDSGQISEQMLLLGVILVIIMILVELPLVFFASAIGERLNESDQLSKRVHQCAGGILISLALYITLTRLAIA
ncbi:Homoserine/homoserine lactone efflux protein (plasmid) [Vibrio sp. THAF191c]|uniref:LysE family translocator n=2 Tax=Vibrio TaxID=662 RepID=UPI001268B496|nr:LysE family translocator [Vibrio sp. THAF64]QFT39787.1 Homoserine/homoserine lactone efflux protein [Vibrio sp. THAF64]QGM37706.1 Homoserine/homoserine lactone efflux protein [Vibrio sp. THAF191d]QGN73049.1 Homoserine/homoserine lactone efflux protein [Vibrio sp. THAF191c]